MYWDDSGEMVHIVKVNKKVRCNGCGQFMKLTDAYLMIEHTYLRVHLKEKCISKAYVKAKANHKEFELAIIRAGVKYGKV